MVHGQGLDDDVPDLDALAPADLDDAREAEIVDEIARRTRRDEKRGRRETAERRAVGKPEQVIFDIARSLLAGCRRVAIVGDNLAADIAGGKRAGLTTILVLTGTSGRDDVAGSEATPDFVVPDLAALVESGHR